MKLYREFVACMAAYIHAESYAPSLDSKEWGQLYSLAKRQSLSGALYTVTEGVSMPDAVRDRLRRDGFLTLARYETQQQVQAAFCDVLSAADLPHLLFKGAVVRRYYRQPAMRTMGDIDAAVHKDALAACHAALLAADFDIVEQQPDVWVYRKHDILIELHTALRRFNAHLSETEPYTAFWTDTRLKNGHTYRFSDEAEAAFALSHMAGHFSGGGCGIRQLMDVAVLYERFPDPALWQGVLTRLSDTGLDDFARRMLWVCRHWFNINIDETLTVPLDADVEARLLTRMLSAGTFGADERRLLSRMRRDRRSQKRGGKAGTLARWLFPSPAYLKRQYAYAEKPLLLPAAYMHRVWDGVTKHRRTHTARLQYAKDHAAQLEAELQLFEDIGL